MKNIKRTDRITMLMKSIEDIVRSKLVTHMEAIIIYCEENDIEVETVATLINKAPSLRSKIQIEAEDVNLLPKVSRLDIP